MVTTAAIAGYLPGIFISKKRLIFVGLFIIVLVIIVIILAALLGKANAAARIKADSEKEPGKEGGSTVGPTVPSSPVPTTPGTEAWWNVRLPNDVIPVHYNVFLDISLQKLRFDGNVDIFVNVTRSTNLILVHSNRMNVTSVAVQNAAGEVNLAIKKHFWFKKNQFTVIEMESNLEPGTFVVKMNFEAFLTESLDGLYKSQYKHADGTNVTIATTQFQPTDARKAFPCFDEPALKATFNISIAHRKDFIAITNMPIYNNEIKNGKKYDYFMKTVVMPTYLLAIVVCDFKHKEITTKNGVKMRFYAPPDQIDQIEYAASVGGKILTFFESYYNISYPLPKADMIAIPDFAAGAMENWGLITYRETALLWKNGSSSARNKQRVATVIAHELAHQWFGNLVTMKWWDDLWLNEGFASFVEYIGVSAVESDWDMNEQFVISDLEAAFALDGLATSHPIKVAVNHPSEINEIFDSISYNKGSSILRMLEGILGKNVFVAGLTKYLKKHAYGNAETDDLWSALEKESCAQGPCVDVKHVMDTWTLQMGYPVLSLNRRNATHVTVSQKHFLFDPKANVSASKYTSPFKYTWVVPFTYKTMSTGPFSVILDKGSVDIAWDGAGWIKGNVGQRGYYRVNYENSNWQKLEAQLKSNHSAFSVSDRAGLIADSFNLARGKMVNYTYALATTSYLRNETDYVAWDAALTGLGYLRNLFSRTSPAYKYLQRYLVYQANPQYVQLGFNDTGNHLEKFKRSAVLGIYCRARKRSCLDKATDYFKKWMEEPTVNAVPSNFRSLVYYYGVANGGVKEWDFVFNQFKKTNIASEARTLMYGMSASSESWILSRYLAYSLDPTKIRTQDATRVVYYVANYNPLGRQLAWDFIRLNWETYKKRYGGGFFAFRNLILGVTRGFSTQFQLKELLKFNEANGDAGSGARAQVQAVERVKANIQWLSENEKDIENWLAKFIKEHNVP